MATRAAGKGLCVFVVDVSDNQADPAVARRPSGLIRQTPDLAITAYKAP